MIEMEAATQVESTRTKENEADYRRTKTKNAKSCGNVFETNILLASAESVRQNGDQLFYLSSV